MPQLDNFIFLMESVMTFMSLFSLLWYNQYIFFPKLLKNLFVKRILLTSVVSNLNLFYSFKYNNLILNKFFTFKFTFFINRWLVFFKRNCLMFLYSISIKNKLIKNKLILFFNKIIWLIQALISLKKTYIKIYQ
jgi:hypothetical protein